MRNLLNAIVISATLSGCAVLPDPIRARFNLPVTTVEAESFGDLEHWWLRFDDPALSAQIERALAANARLEEAQANVESAAAEARIAYEHRLPKLDAHLGPARQRRSLKTATAFPGLPVITNSLEFGLTASYELDLWGRLRLAERAAIERLGAQRWAQNALRGTIAAQVARTVFLIRTLEREVELTESTIALADEALLLLERQRDAGIIGDFELLQNRAERDNFAVRQTDLRESLQRARRSLSALAGGQPDAIYVAGGESDGRPLPDIPPLPSELPSSLLARRPDVQQSEAELRAAKIDIAVARSSYFPVISLTGGAGYQSKALSSLLTSPARTWSLGTTLLQPLLSAPQMDTEIRVSRAAAKAAEARYVQVMQNAFVDAGDALGARGAAHEARLLQERREQELTETLRMATRRFDAGLTGALDVIDARRNLLAAQLDALDRRNAELGATVDIFRALGGGWSEL